MSPHHQQVELHATPGQWADAGIARMVDFLNERGCNTFASCEDEDDGFAYVACRDPESLLVAVRELAALAYDASDMALLCRILKAGALPGLAPPQPPETLRRYGVQPQWLPGRGGGSLRRPKLDLYVRIPIADLAQLTALINGSPD